VPTDIETDSQTSPDALTDPSGPTTGAEAGYAATAAPARARRPRAVAADAALAAAVDQARDAAVEVAEGDGVGEHLSTTAEGDRVLTHLFECTCLGYRGWRWAVTVARAPRSKHVTVSEVHLLPGPDAVVSPTWLPWADRIAPGDVGPGTVLPKRHDDPLLDEGFEATGDEDVDQLAIVELGLGRPRVLSREGREVAAQRWYDGSHGPRDPHAEQAPAQCRTCGYFVPMAGALRQLFGVCASEWSPSDGSVVSLDHGCGAHSEVDVDARPETLDSMVLDELGYVDVDVRRTPSASEAAVQPGVVEPGVVEPVVVEPVVVETVVVEPVVVEPVVVQPVVVESAVEPGVAEPDAVQPGPPGEPYPDPTPLPEPYPDPTPQPGPEPLPQPGPEPTPQPDPEPLPGTVEPGTVEPGTVEPGIEPGIEPGSQPGSQPGSAAPDVWDSPAPPEAPPAP
jgi:hypothetical protein